MELEAYKYRAQQGPAGEMSDADDGLKSSESGDCEEATTKARAYWTYRLKTTGTGKCFHELLAPGETKASR